ncbi:MAG TPA: SRPBCC family protein [Ohtaekwangia sp.]|nr:SRPBCC family protein [Ohtaekwangia sp.]
MPLIELTTLINAPIERCFDLARSIDLHKLSTEGTNEEAIAGVTSGLIGKNEQVTWQARHFGITQTLTSRITAFEYPCHFRDEMIQGAFKVIRHDHIFQTLGTKTEMRDKFYFESPGWILGVCFNQLVLTKYLRALLNKRNEIIRDVAESERWKIILKM